MGEALDAPHPSFTRVMKPRYLPRLQSSLKSYFLGGFKKPPKKADQ